MKKLFVIFFLWLAAVPCSAHKEWVHQYIVQEAYRYLEKQVGAIPTLRDYVGVNSSGPAFFGSGKGEDRPWELPHPIAIGVWQEDILDPVWRYYGFANPIYDLDHLVSITHFWSAQDGDDNETHFNNPAIADYPNAFLKARNYMNNGLNLTGEHGLYLDGKYTIKSTVLGINAAFKCEAVQFEYQDLCDLITNGNCNVPKGYYFGIPKYLVGDRQSYFSAERAKIIGFTIFGHLLHLLGDMGCPAHTHADTHPCNDDYELAMGSNLGSGDCSDENQYKYADSWTANTSSRQGGLLYEVFSMSDRDALRYMFYTMNRLSSHFASNDEQGNDWLWNGNSMLVSARYSMLGSTATNTSDWNGTNTNFTSINYAGDELLNYAIRVTATAMYWFSIKTGLVGCPQTLYQQSHTYYGARTASENATFKASSKIIAGRNVNPNLTSSQGNVVVESGTLTYLAGDEIQLKDGFIAKAGSNFHAKIQNACPLTTQTCTYSENSGTNSNNIENLFSKKAENLILETNDTLAQCSIVVFKNSSLTTSGDTVFLSSWTRTSEIPRVIDTSDNDNQIIELPLLLYSDSVIIISEGDSMLYAPDDSVLLVENRFCTIILTDSTAVIIKSDTSGTSRNNGDDYTPRIYNIYPNPNSDYIDMQIDGRGSSSTVTIYTQMGVKISETTVGSSEKLSRVSTSGLAPGMYMVVVKTAKGKTSKNFVVHR
jgi:hypothetical protein